MSIRFGIFERLTCRLSKWSALVPYPPKENGAPCSPVFMEKSKRPLHDIHSVAPEGGADLVDLTAVQTIAGCLTKLELIEGV